MAGAHLPADFGLWTGLETFGRRVEQPVSVLQFVFGEPVGVSLEQEREVVEFVLEFAAQIGAGGQRAEFGGRELMLLQFAEQLAELLGKTGAARAGAKQFQFAFVPQQQGAQHHHAAFLGKQSRRHRDAERVEDEPREPLERKNVQPRVALADGAVGKQLAFELKRGLFGREQNQRRAFRRCRQSGADFRQTAKCLAAAGRTEEKTRLHSLLFAQRREIAKQFIAKFWQGLVGGRTYFLFPFRKVVLLFLSVGKIPAG